MIKFSEIRGLLNFHGVSFEIDNWYSISGPGDITFTVHYDGYRLNSTLEEPSVHKDLPQLLKEVGQLSDRAWEIESDELSS